MSPGATRSLLQAVRLPVIAKRSGQLAVVVAALTLVPMAVALVSGELVPAWRYGAVSVVLAAAGGLMARLAAPRDVQVNEGLVVGLLAFVATPLAMTWPLMASGVGFGDALFECISAITTTGLSTLAGVQGRPPSFLFERAWLQWIGGLGIVVLSVALLSGNDVASRRLIESPLTPETLETTTRTHARRTFLVYLALTALALALLWLAGWGGFDAVLLALATVSTGGFVPFDGGLTHASLWPARMAVVGVAVLGALPLGLYHAAWRRRWDQVVDDPELRLFVLVASVLCIALALLMWRQRGVWSADVAGHAVAMALTAQTTSGFATLPPAHLDAASKLVLIVAMAVGGGVGSTAGGIKLLRLWLLLRVAQLVLRRTAMPAMAVTPLTLRGRAVAAEDLSGALFVVLLFVLTVLASWLPFLLAGFDPLSALFEVVSAVGTVGLSAGVAGPGLSDGLKAVLCVDMLMGRVEFVALLVLLYPGTWFGRRRLA
jgi:trk system potassium uptake protein TrkH